MITFLQRNMSAWARKTGEDTIVAYDNIDTLTRTSAYSFDVTFSSAMSNTNYFAVIVIGIGTISSLTNVTVNGCTVNSTDTISAASADGVIAFFEGR